MPLISRRTFPPGGFQFFDPKTNWHAPGGLTFDQVVEQIIKQRAANPRFSSDWSLDRTDVENELDNYTCVRIAQNPNYCKGGASLPFSQGPAPTRGLPAQTKGISQSAVNVAGVGKKFIQSTKKIVSGIGLLIDWLGKGAKPVENDLANRRAEICAGCPQNQVGDLTRWFTVPASEMIRKQLSIRSDMSLETQFDDRLGVCQACACPMKLKVHTPLSHILDHLLPESKESLDPRCWITKETLLNSP